jgi:hypothetical protein
LWTNVLRMHEPIATVDPATALAVGLKVDVEALPPAIIAALRAGQVDLTHPAVTTQLLRLNALSPALPATLKAEFRRWGPGKYDPRHHAFDGTNLIPRTAHRCRL